ncbi:MAG: hypothetical protein ACYC91_04240 [Solirubrobacteraceae bacterium]
MPNGFRGSKYANQAPGILPPLAQISRVANGVDHQQSLVHVLQRTLALPRFGSNAVIVSARLTADHRPMLYGGPQTGGPYRASSRRPSSTTRCAISGARSCPRWR